MRAFAGNDVVDLADPLRREHFGAAEDGFAERHLSPRERDAWTRVARKGRFGWFWTRFAAKEAAYKAFDQAGIPTPRGAAGYAQLETSDDAKVVTHLPTGSVSRLASLEVTKERIHAVYFFLEGEEGGRAEARLVSSVASVPTGREASDVARSLLVQQAADTFEESLSALCVTSVDGRPRLFAGGRLLPHSVSLSHSGRFAAASLLLA